MFLEILLSLFFSFNSFFVQPVYAQESPILFWGTTCPYCHTVLEQMEEEGIEELVVVEKLEIYGNRDNQAIFQEKVSECSINTNRAGIPLLFYDGECYIGPDSIMDQLRGIAGIESETPVVEGQETENSSTVTEDEGKRNTGVLILGIIGFLVAIVLVGGIMQGNKSKGVASVFLILGITLLSVKPTFAMCPVCTAAVGLGLGLSRYFGIDDVITGVWIGGLVVSSIMWLVGVLDKKGVKKWFRKALVPISMYALLGITLYLLDFVGHPLNTLWGVDKIVLGIISGGLIFFLAGKLHLHLKEKNNGKIYFPFQKVVFTIASLLILTVVFYFIVY